MYDIIYRQKGKDYYSRLWHTPEKNVFLFVHSGNGNIEAREKSYTFAPGAFCFIGERKYHYTFSALPEEYVRSKLFIETGILNKLIDAIGSSPDFNEIFSENSIAIAPLSEDDEKKVSSLFEYLNGLSKGFKYSEAEFLSAAIQFMIILAKNISVATVSNTDALQNVIRFINSHISEELSIDRISAECYINKYYLCRLFKKKLGITYMEYILQTRLAMAKELLANESFSITQVSILSGFSSPSYFSRIFKESIGSTPMEYRKNAIQHNHPIAKKEIRIKG